jgi:glycosyltransferase involved in cell wall biosynthesis
MTSLSAARQNALARLLTATRAKFLPRLPTRIAKACESAFRYVTLRRLKVRRAPPLTLLFSHDLSRSGAPRLVLEMARLLRDAGHRMLVMAPAGGHILTDLLAEGFDVIVDPRLATASYLPALAGSARLAIFNTVESWPMLEQIVDHVPSLWYIHEVSLLDDRLADPRVRQSLDKASIVWAGSPMCAQKLAPMRHDVVVVPYGLAPLGAPLTSRSTRLLIVGVFASVEHRKGQDLAVDALRELPLELMEHLQLRFYGRVLEPYFAKTTFTNLDSLPARYYGELDALSYKRAMAEVDSVLVSSRDDTLPLVSLDALSLGKLLILTPSVGTGSWLEDGKDVLIADETSARGIAAALARAQSIQDRQPLADAARLAFDRHFSQGAFRSHLMEAVATLGSDR